MRYIFFALCIIALLGACKKDPLTQHAEGYLKEFGTNKPLANTALVLVADYSAFGGTYQDMDTAYTDENGFCEFDFAPIEGWVEFRLISDMFYGVNSMSYSGKQRRDIEFDLTARPKAWIKFHVKNVNPVDENDFFQDSDIIEAYGTDVDTLVIKESSFANRDARISALVWRNGISTYYRDTFYVPAYDTTLIEVSY